MGMNFKQYNDLSIELYMDHFIERLEFSHLPCTHDSYLYVRAKLAWIKDCSSYVAYSVVKFAHVTPEIFYATHGAKF